MPEFMHGLRVRLDSTHQDKALWKAVALQLRVPPYELIHVEIRKKSLDARRKKQGPSWVFSVDAWVKGEEAELKVFLEGKKERGLPKTPTFRIEKGMSKGPKPIVVGMGPAGLFAALAFADSGIPCTVLERGAPLEERHHHVRDFRRRGELNPESNLCFGEGGAGTYSDGKLYTRKKHAMVHAVYERLVAFGATPSILTDAHPHIGTNRLYAILEGMREYLKERGVEIRFNACVEELILRDSTVEGVRLRGGQEVLGGPVMMASGHSARNLYETLHHQGIPLEPKSFAIGARCEHPQSLIDERQLGPIRNMEGVEPAEYFLACQLGKRGLYSFCMCPGGFIIPTPTEPGHLNVNGMSNSNRGGDFANAALVVTVEPGDFYIERPGDLEHHGVLAGLAFQRHWEKQAFLAGGSTYCAPAQRLTDLVEGRPSSTLPGRTSYRPGLVAGTMDGVLPPSIVKILQDGLPLLNRKLPGYLMEEGVLVGVETTTSTPVRMARQEDRQSPGVSGLYPTGEGAGYSGGIVSSAIEGVLSAHAAIERYFS